MRALPRGFTLIEIIVVIAIFSILITLGLFMSIDTFRGAFHRSEVDVIVSVLQKARSRAMNNIEQSTWGVCYLAPQYLILKNSSTCDSASAADTFAANPSVAEASKFNNTPSTFPIVVFSQLSGATAEKSFDVVQDARTSTISINHEGTITW